jgi:hypothetical protein
MLAQLLAVCGWRHQLVGVVRRDAGYQRAFFRLARHDRCVVSQVGPDTIGRIEPQTVAATFAIGRIGTVAFEAGVRQNGFYITLAGSRKEEEWHEENDAVHSAGAYLV